MKTFIVFWQVENMHGLVIHKDSRKIVSNDTKHAVYMNFAAALSTVYGPGMDYQVDLYEVV